MDFHNFYGGADWGWFPSSGGRYERRYGQQAPFFQSEQELEWLRSASRWVAGWNGGHASGFLGGLCSYVIHKGILGKLSPRDGSNDPGDADLCHAAMDELDQFYQRTQFTFAQQVLYNKSHIDGDFTWWLFDMGDQLELRYVEPGYIRCPPGESFDVWGYGIATPADDVVNHQAYAVCDPNGRDWQSVPASDIIYVPFYRPGGWEPIIKRGMPLFAFGIKEAFDSAGKILRNAGEGTAIREAFAYVEQVAPGTSRTDASDFVTAKADVEVSRPFNANATNKITKVDPGYVPRTPPGYEFKPPPQHPGVGQAIEIIDALLRNAGAVKNAPPWLMNTSGRDQGAYSSDLVHGAPFVRRCEQEQEYYGWPIYRVIRRQLEIAIRCGRLHPDTLKRCKLSVEPPGIVTHDKAEEANTNKVYVDLGVKSRQQVAQEQGLDFEKQFKENQEYAKRTQAAGMPAPGGEPGGAGVAPPPAAAPDEQQTDEGASLDPFDVFESADLTEAVESALIEGGFSGTITDSAGRKITFRDGVRVKGSGGASTGKSKGGKTIPTVGPHGVVHKPDQSKNVTAKKPAKAPGAKSSAPPKRKESAPASPPASLASNFSKLVSGAVKLTDAHLDAIGERINQLPAQALEAAKQGIRDLLAKAAGFVTGKIEGATRKADEVAGKAKAGAAKVKAFHEKVNSYVSHAASVLDRMAKERS